MNRDMEKADLSLTAVRLVCAVMEYYSLLYAVSSLIICLDCKLIFLQKNLGWRVRNHFHKFSKL
jgi:hypothetical protein